MSIHRIRIRVQAGLILAVFIAFRNFDDEATPSPLQVFILSHVCNNANACRSEIQLGQYHVDLLRLHATRLHHVMCKFLPPFNVQNRSHFPCRSRIFFFISCRQIGVSKLFPSAACSIAFLQLGCHFPSPCPSNMGPCFTVKVNIRKSLKR